MAINPIHLLAASTAKATNGSNIIEVFGNTDASRVYQGSVITLGTFAAVEGISGTAPNSDGSSTITLFEPWPEVTTTARLTAFNSLEGLTGAIEKSRQVVAATSSIEAISGTGLLEKTGTDAYAVTPITAQAKLLLDDINSQEQRDTLELGNVDNTSDELKPVSSVQKVINATISKAEFFALAQKRIRDSAGSGFSEWGKTRTLNGYLKINEGLGAGTLSAPRSDLIAGHVADGGSGNISRTNDPIVVVNGYASVVSGINSALNNTSNFFNFPPVPNGLKTYNKATGAVVTHANTATAFGSESADNKVITSRQDFAFLESWHEVIEDKDVAYPLGNVQYGAASYKGISLINSLVAQGYSAFGEWDTETRGYGVQWSTLTDAQRILFAQDHENNIYFDNEVGKHIQVRYRVRVVEGLGNDWGDLGSQLAYPLYGSLQLRLTPQGKNLTVQSLVTNSNFATHYWGSSKLNNVALAQGGLGHYVAASNLGSTDTSIAHNGLCFAVPIALVQRRNQGAYNPTYNTNGSSKQIKADNSQWVFWYEDTAKEVDSTQVCFTDHNNGGAGDIDGDRGSISVDSGRPDGKFFDAIYASDVKDLRMSSKILPVDEIREKYKRMAIAGEVRGFEGVPFSDTFVVSKDAANSSTVLVVLISDIEGFVAYPAGVVIASGSALNEDTGIAYNVKTVETDGNKLYFSLAGLNSISSGSTWSVVCGRISKHKQANPSWTDIVGDPARIAATFPDGVEGQWIPTIPDGDLDSFPLNRKSTVTGDGAREFTANDGGTWTGSVGSDFNSSNNSVSYTNLPSNTVSLLHYETQAHFTKDDVNSRVLSLGGVTITNAVDKQAGNFIMGSLINKVGIASGGLNLVNTPLQTSTVYLGKLFTNSPFKPSHNGVAISTVNNSSTVKTLDYLSSENNVAKLMYVYKEMVYDTSAELNDTTELDGTETNETLVTGQIYRVLGGNLGGLYLRSGISANVNMNAYYVFNGKIYANTGTESSAFTILLSSGFGDNNQFEIVDNQSSLTDDNGNSVLHGMASFDTQYFIVEK